MTTFGDRAGALSRMTPPLAAVVLVAALALAGCGAAAGVADMPPAHDFTATVSAATVSTATTTAASAAALPAQLAGRTFLSTAAAGRDLVPDSTVTLSFNDDGSVGANAGCNHMGGTPVWDGETLTVPDMYTTEMACEQPLMEQEQWLAGLLRDGVAVALSGTALTLTAGGVTVDLLDRTVADPDRPLTGTTWTLDGIISGSGDSGSVSSVPLDLTVTLRVGAEQLDVFNGLTWLTAPLADQDLSANSGRVRVAGALSGDAIGCAGGGTDCFVDVSVLGSDFDYEITADRLTVSGAERTTGQGLMFRAE